MVAWAAPCTTRLLVFCGMLDHRNDTTRHEASAPNDHSRTRHLGDFDRSTNVSDFDPAAGFRSFDLVGLRPVTDVDDDLDAVPLHVSFSLRQRKCIVAPTTS